VAWEGAGKVFQAEGELPRKPFWRGGERKRNIDLQGKTRVLEGNQPGGGGEEERGGGKDSLVVVALRGRGVRVWEEHCSLPNPPMNHMKEGEEVSGCFGE